MEVYLDNSATTKPYKEVIDAVSEVMESTWGNPSSMHMLGVDAEKYLTKSTEMISQTLRCKPSEILYTSGGTESDNMALIGVAHARKRAGRHIITTSIEHPAVINTMKHLEQEGYEVTFLPVDKSGVVRMDELEKAVTNETILVSIMHINNEIGSVQPIDEIGKIIKQKNPETLFHVDAVQGFGKIPLYPKKAGIDLMSMSSHKIHGPKEWVHFMLGTE